MISRLELGNVTVDVVLKDIKNVHLSVHPPTGRVHISAPRRTDLDTIRMFAISKLDWIRRQRTKLIEQERETPREYVDMESHYVWGKRYLLVIQENHGPLSIQLKHRHMLMCVRRHTGRLRRDALMEQWYREQLKAAVPPLLTRWQPLIGVEVKRFFVQRMKTMWGSCNHNARTIRLNTDLAKKPAECLEYIVVHELAHLVEPTHNVRFIALMDGLMPRWRSHREVLNRLPIRQVSWSY